MTIEWYIHTARETYSVDETSNIGRPAMKMPPSGQWKAVALVRPKGWGYAEFIGFQFWHQRLPTEWRYKNGNPKYRLRDLDHGTARQWGEPILSVYRA